MHALTQPVDWLRNLNHDLGKLVLAGGGDRLTYSKEVSAISGDDVVRVSDDGGTTRLDFKIVPYKYKKMGPNDSLDLDR